MSFDSYPIILYPKIGQFGGCYFFNHRSHACEEIGDQDEGAPRCLQERDIKKFGRTCVEGILPHQMGGDFSSRPGQKTQGTIAEGGPPHSNDSC